MKEIKIIYRCDNSNCHKILKSPHLSITFDKYSGWVKKQKNGTWRHQGQIQGIYQFCSPDCMAQVVNALAVDLDLDIEIE